MDLFGEESPVQETTLPPPVTDNAHELSEELQHPRTMGFCLGHETVEQKLLQSWQNGTLPHGLIFSGPKGIGKTTFAYRFAKFLLTQGIKDPGQDSLFEGEENPAESFDTAPDNPVVTKIVAGSHPDLMSVERSYDPAKNLYKQNIEVEKIRKVPSFLRMTASEGGWRVVIIDDADTMNRNAQNALLKILEEPPQNSILILIAHRAGALIPTIRSRTQIIPFQPLAKENLERLLSMHPHDLPSGDLEFLLEFSEGSAGKALMHIEEGGLETLSKILKLFDKYPNWDWPEIHELAEYLGRKGQDSAFHMFENFLLWIFLELTTAKARGQALQTQTLDQDSFQTLLKNSSLESLLNICENLQEHFEKVRASNLDKRQAVLSAFSMISAE